MDAFKEAKRKCLCDVERHNYRVKIESKLTSLSFIYHYFQLQADCVCM